MKDQGRSEELFQALLNSSPIGIYMVQDGRFLTVNPKFEELTGYSQDELLGSSSLRLVLPEDEPLVRKNAARMLRGERSSPYEYRIVKKGGAIRWIVETVTSIQHQGRRAVLSNFMDITERKNAEEELRQSEEKYRTIFEATGTAIAILEEDGFISLLNTESEKLFGISKEAVEGKLNWREFVAPEDVERMEEHHRLSETRPYSSPRRYECRLVDRMGKPIDVIINVGIISGTRKRVVSIQDITERKQMEEQLKYLSLNDPLTGLYNRVYFEEEMRRMEGGRFAPIGIIVCDLDGLKLVNDTMGHDAGDVMLLTAAGLIKRFFRDSDVVARIGGDEFSVILPCSPWTVVENACRRIRDAVETYNLNQPQLPLSLSIGMAVSNDATVSMADLFKEADNNMYREKLNQGQKARRAIIQTLWRDLEKREFVTAGRTGYLQRLVTRLAKAMGLSERSVTDLRLLAQFHDIGNIGIHERIFLKPDIFTLEERLEMQRHCEIGHRIAQSSPELVPIADWILKHHEWWNGGGYPLGLKGREIPLECRILAVTAAYQAMVSDRPYRKALSHEDAVKELKELAGTQFDPRVTKKFIQVLNQEPEQNTVTVSESPMPSYRTRKTYL